jgi:hypothetical protein
MINKLANQHTNVVIDQSTDTDFSVLHQVFSKLASEDLKDFLDTIVIDYDGIEKLSSDRFADQDNQRFPVDSAENTVLSKLYFDHQRDQISEKTASAIESRLDTFLDIYGIPESIFKYEDQEKTASEETMYLLPEMGMCKVASQEDLYSLGKDFSRNYHQLDIPDRVEFSQNFFKAAAQFGAVEYPTVVAKYAAQLDTDLANTKYLLQARALLAARTGQEGSEYTKLAESLDDITDNPNTEELQKLAETIYNLDQAKGFDAPKYDRCIPCAYGSVFNKVATGESESTDNEEEYVGDKDVEKMDKATIIGTFGAGVLEEVEKEDGEIDYERLKEISKLRQDLKTPIDQN